MSIRKKEPAPFTKKQLTVIFKIAFLEAMALSIIIPTTQSSGEIPFTDQVNECVTVNGFPNHCPTLETITQQYNTYAGFQQIINVQFTLKPGRSVTVLYENCFTDAVNTGAIFASIIIGGVETDFDCVANPVNGALDGSVTIASGTNIGVTNLSVQFFQLNGNAGSQVISSVWIIFLN